MHFACAVEGRYVPHAAAMLHSALAHAGRLDARVHYMHGRDLSRRDALRLTQMVERLGASIDFHEVPDHRLAGVPTKGFTLKATWYRIFLPELVPDVDRVLYLDADLIVTDDLLPLWRTEMGDSYVGAVTNVLPSWHAHRPAELGLTADVYFNAGVLLMNLAQMRADGTSDALLDYSVANAPNLAWRDQDALNVVLGARRVSLHPRWNCMNAVMLFDDEANEVFGPAVVEQARRDPAIRHFEGPGLSKPWHYLAGQEARDLYMRHRAETPWPRLRPAGRTPASVLRRVRAR